MTTVRQNQQVTWAAAVRETNPTVRVLGTVKGMATSVKSHHEKAAKVLRIVKRLAVSANNLLGYSKLEKAQEEAEEDLKAVVPQRTAATWTRIL